MELKHLEEQVGWLDRRLSRRPPMPGLIMARYKTATAQDIETGATGEVLNYDTKVYDNYNCVTTGAAWKFVTPITGYFRVSAAMLFADSAAWTEGESALLQIHKNGSVYSNIDYFECPTVSAAFFLDLQGSDTVMLNKGDYIHIQIIQISGSTIALHNNANYNYVTIEQCDPLNGVVGLF